LRLLLLRHAKSDWSGSLGDHDRPLAARGRKAAPRMGAVMRKKGYVPALVLCSTAERTKETLELLLPALRADPKIQYDRALYLAEWPVLLAILQGAAADTPLLMIGHNPGLEQLASALAVQPQDAAERARSCSPSHLPGAQCRLIQLASYSSSTTTPLFEIFSDECSAFAGSHRCPPRR